MNFNAYKNKMNERFMSLSNKEKMLVRSVLAMPASQPLLKVLGSELSMGKSKKSKSKKRGLGAR